MSLERGGSTHTQLIKTQANHIINFDASICFSEMSFVATICHFVTLCQVSLVKASLE